MGTETCVYFNLGRKILGASERERKKAKKQAIYGKTDIQVQSALCGWGGPPMQNISICIFVQQKYVLIQTQWRT